MNQMIIFFMTTPIICKNQPDFSKTIHQHFIKDDEATRLEAD